ncbi:MAG: hypothetical protein ACE5I7_13250 [Candidatus Binatia bacterium]
MTQWGVQRWQGIIALGAFLCMTLPARGHAYSLLPLVTEDARPLPNGVAEVSLGIAYFKDLRFPAFTPPRSLRSQDLLGLPQSGVRIGAGDWVEIQATYEALYLDERAADGKKNSKFGSGDLRLFTKVRLMREADLLPALGLRFGTKLPNASQSDRLGTDETDFGADVLASKSVGLLTAHVNLGLLLLGNPGSSGGQDDLFNYALGLSSLPLGTTQVGGINIKLLGELAGLAGSRFDNDRTAVRVGLQMQRGPATLYIGVNTGLVTASENLGVSTGFVYTFEPAKLLRRE